jgi:hypothetical protein
VEVAWEWRRKKVCVFSVDLSFDFAVHTVYKKGIVRTIILYLPSCLKSVEKGIQKGEQDRK